MNPLVNAPLSRRSLCVLAAAALTACSADRSRHGPGLLETLRIRHPETLAFAAPFQLMDSGHFTRFAKKLDVGKWASPDMLRAMLVNGESEVTAVPSYVGANLANRGIDIAMAAVVVWGIVWLIGPEGAAPDWKSLKGQTVLVPLPNDMPDLVFRHLATSNGLTPGKDMTVEYYAQAPEVIARIVSGKGDWAVLPEHVVSLALLQAKKNGRNISRCLDLQQEWAKVEGASPQIPQGGIVMPTSLARDRPELLGSVLDELTRTVAAVNTRTEDIVATLSKATGVPAPVVADVIPRLNLKVVPAADARAELEKFYTTLAKLSPDIIGKKLPGDSFYLPDPR